ATAVHLDLQHGGAFLTSCPRSPGILLVSLEPGEKQRAVVAFGPRIAAGTGVGPASAVAAAFTAGPALVAGLLLGIGGLRAGGGGGWRRCRLRRGRGRRRPWRCGHLRRWLPVGFGR